MEAIQKIVGQNLKNKALEYNKLKKCPHCGEPIERITFLSGFNKYIKGPVLCSCEKRKLERKHLEEINKEKQIRLHQIINNSLMDELFKKCTFQNWDHKIANKKIFEISKTYALDFKKVKNENLGLLIYGQPGNGKTFASSCIANYLLKKYITVICVSINSLLSRIKKTYDRFGKEGEDTIINSLQNAELLIIDDLGTEQNTDWSKAIIYRILDSRYRNNSPLIITTNISLEDIKEIYNKRTYDRLIQMCTPVFNKWKSIRTIKAIEQTKKLKELIN